MVNAIYVPGGAFDPSKKLCIDEPLKPAPDSRRETFERLLIYKALNRGIPILGICAGSWILASCYGAKTKQLPEEMIGLHEQGKTLLPTGRKIRNLRIPVHNTTVPPGSMLYGIVKNASAWESKIEEGRYTKVLVRKFFDKPIEKSNTSTDFETGNRVDLKSNTENSVIIGVNSTHRRVLVSRQGFSLANTNKMLLVSAHETSHHEVEAFETRFGVPVIGIQFHPEYRIPAWVDKDITTPDLDYPANRRILEAFAQSAKTHALKMEVVSEIQDQQLRINAQLS